MNLTKRIPYRNQAIRDSANSEECTLNSPICNYDPTTTVFCHLNEDFAGKGKGLKAADIGFYGCYNCHTAYDTGKLPDPYFYLLRAVVRTWLRLLEKGIIKD